MTTGDRREEILRTLAKLGENTIAIIGMRADFYGLAAGGTTFGVPAARRFADWWSGR